MGAGHSYAGITDEELQVYEGVTGLNAAEIQHAFKRFFNIDPLCFQERRKGRVSYVTVVETLSELKNNPFRYQIGKVFCSSDSGFMDFDDFIELVTAMSDRAPLSVKIFWAFKIYDFNDDGIICEEDLNTVMDKMTNGKATQLTKDKIIERVLAETDKDGDGALSFQEFERTVSLNSPEFKEAFRFVL